VWLIVFLPSVGIVYEFILCQAQNDNFGDNNACNDSRLTICYCKDWNDFRQSAITSGIFGAFFSILIIFHL